jgi:hypothetical protein
VKFGWKVVGWGGKGARSMCAAWEGLVFKKKEKCE